MQLPAPKVWSETERDQYPPEMNNCSVLEYLHNYNIADNGAQNEGDIMSKGYTVQ